jgi:hypothetical protein
MKTVLEDAAFKDVPIDPNTTASLAAQADELVQQMKVKAHGVH